MIKSIGLRYLARRFIFFSVIIRLFQAASATQAMAGVPITILHTNDVHSHFRPEQGPLKWGGLARMSTLIHQLRSEIPNTFLVDGGDWSEGNVYYFNHAGVENIEMMNLLGYDAAVIGNHDWLNGPDVLLDLLEKNPHSTSFLSANLNVQKYPRAEDFKKWIQPYIIREIQGVKIAFIGLSTYEWVYDSFLKPVEIQEPFLVARSLANKLKEEDKVDVVVAISHNSVLMNKGLLKAASNIDLVIGAHDHKKLTQPVVVERWGANPAWIVETGSWGRYLGRVDLEINQDPGDPTAPKSVNLLNYRLIQIDSRIPEDPVIQKKIEKMESELETRYGPIFHDQIGVSKTRVAGGFHENGLGYLMCDAYMKLTQADFAVTSSKFMYGDIHEGPIRTVDALNATPAIFNPKTDKAWTVKVLPLSGRALKWLLYATYSTHKIGSLGLLGVSGLSFNYDPLLPKSTNYSDQYELNSLKFTGPGLQTMGVVRPMAIPVVQDIRVQGQPLELDRKYKIAVSDGFIEGIRFLNSTITEMISLNELADTGVENWRILADFIHGHAPLTHENIGLGERIKTIHSNLGIYYDDIQWTPIPKSINPLKETITAEVRVHIKNYGMNSSEAGSDEEGPSIHLLSNTHGLNLETDPDYREIGSKQPIPSLAPGESVDLTWKVEVPQYSQLYPITVKIEGVEDEVEQSNHEVTRWFIKK